MCHSIEDLPRSDCTYPRHKEKKDTSPIICWKINLILLSLISEINNNLYQQQIIITVANKVAKNLVKI